MMSLMAADSLVQQHHTLVRYLKVLETPTQLPGPVLDASSPSAARLAGMIEGMHPAERSEAD